MKEPRDRVTHRPRTLRALLRWAQAAYGDEPPPRLHDRDIADDGAPDFTPQAAHYLGLERPRHLADDAPDEWQAVACRRDEDGFFRTPLRCAIEQIKSPQRRDLVRGLVTNVLFPGDVAALYGIPDWCAEDVVLRSLNLLWDIYTDRPIPKPSRPGWVDLSESQRNAEDAA